MGTDAAIYTRISLDRHDGAGVERQERDCRELAARHGLTVAGVYCDNSISAYSGKTRPAFERLIADVQAGRVATVIVWATDRLYRKLTDLERLVDMFGDTPVLAVKSGDVDLSTADGRMTARIMGTVAQHSSEKQGERVAAAARQRARSGRVATARRPFGWQPRPGGGFQPHPAEAPAVATAYDMLTSGHSLSAIARWLNGQGFTGTSGSRWTQARVSELLRAPRNGGMSAYRGEILADVPNIDGALVPADTWWQAHRLMSDPSRLKRGPAPANLITGGIARCYKCGSPVTASGSVKRGGERYLTYACKPGGHVQVTREVLDQWVSQRVVEHLTANRGVLLAAMAEARAEAVDRAGGSAAADLARMRGDREGLAQALASGAVSLAAFTAAASALDARIAAAEQSLAPSPAPAAGRLLAADDIAEAWRDTDLPAKREVLAELVERIVVHRAGGERFEMRWRGGTADAADAPVSASGAA